MSVLLSKTLFEYYVSTSSILLLFEILYAIPSTGRQGSSSRAPVHDKCVITFFEIFQDLVIIYGIYHFSCFDFILF